MIFFVLLKQGGVFYISITVMLLNHGGTVTRWNTELAVTSVLYFLRTANRELRTAFFFNHGGTVTPWNTEFSCYISIKSSANRELRTANRELFSSCFASMLL